MKKLLCLIGLLCLTAKAEIVTGVIATNAAVSVLTNAVVINSIQLSATTSAPFVVNMYDVASATLTYTNAAYTNTTSFTTNLVTTFVGATGVTNSYTNTVLFTTATITAANTNNVNAIGAWAMGTSESMMIPGPFVMARGVTLKCVAPYTNGTYVINYRTGL